MPKMVLELRAQPEPTYDGWYVGAASQELPREGGGGELGVIIIVSPEMAKRIEANTIPLVEAATFFNRLTVCYKRALRQLEGGK